MHGGGFCGSVAGCRYTGINREIHLQEAKESFKHRRIAVKKKWYILVGYFFHSILRIRFLIVLVLAHLGAVPACAYFDFTC